MYTVIRPNIDFKLNSSGCVDVLEDMKKIGEIDTAIYAMLCMFNGFLSDEQIKNVLKIYDNDKIFALVTSKFDYILFKTNDYKRELDPFTISHSHINFTKLRSLVPQVLVISLTHDCFMRCRYCYAGAKHSSYAREKNSLDIGLLHKIVAQAKDLGISNINLTGGDPFARADIFDVLNIFTQNKIKVDISTKKCFSEEEIRKLVQHKDTINLQISLDTLNDEIQEDLIGYKNYSSNMLSAIRRLNSFNFKIKVNSVITSLTIRDLPKLVEQLDEMGVDTCVLSPYTNNLWRCDETLFPAYMDYVKLSDKLDALNVKTRIQRETLLRNFDSEKEKDDNRICSAGEDGFVIGPNGSVAICERLLYHEEFSLGNIKIDSLLDIWNSEKIKTFYIPSQKQFEGTKCFTCDQFNYCTNVRGICYVNSIIINGKPFSPDSKCKYYNGIPRIF